MVSLADGDYTSSAISIFPAPQSKYVIGGNPNQKMVSQLETVHPSTVPFHQRENCKSLVDSEGRLFSNLSEDEVWKLLGPYFQSAVTDSPPRAEGSGGGFSQYQEVENERPKKKRKDFFLSSPLGEELSNVEPAPFKPGDSAGLELSDGVDGLFEAEIIRDLLSS